MTADTSTRQFRKWFERLLLQISAHVNSSGHVGVNPYEFSSVEEFFLNAARHGYEDIIRGFVTSNILDVNCTNKNGWTALLHAATNNQTGIVVFLIDHGACLGARNCHGSQALHLAAGQGFLDTVKVLVEAGADIGSVGKADLTPLLTAIRYGHFPVVKFLVEWLLSKNEQETLHELLEVRVAPGGWTPLNVAAYDGNLDIVVFLTEHGAMLNTKNDNKFSPLHSAVANDHMDVVRHLLSVGATLICATQSE